MKVDTITREVVIEPWELGLRKPKCPIKLEFYNFKKEEDNRDPSSLPPGMCIACPIYYISFNILKGSFNYLLLRKFDIELEDVVYKNCIPHRIVNNRVLFRTSKYEIRYKKSRD